MPLAASAIPVPPNSGIQVTHTSGVDVDDIARRQLADREAQYANHKARMSWDDMGRLPKKGPKTVGRVDKNYPYSLVEGKVYVQNCKVFLSNGLTEVDPYTYAFDKDPIECERLRARVLDAFKSYTDAALEEDQLLCPYCLKFHAKNPLEFADHVIVAHAGQYGQHLGYGKTETPKPQPEVETINLPKVPGGYTATATTVTDEKNHPVAMTQENPALDVTPLVCIKPCGCGRVFRGQPALKRHLTAYKKRAASA